MAVASSGRISWDDSQFSDYSRGQGGLNRRRIIHRSRVAGRGFFGHIPRAYCNRDSEECVVCVRRIGRIGCLSTAVPEGPCQGLERRPIHVRSTRPGRSLTRRRRLPVLVKRIRFRDGIHLSLDVTTVTCNSRYMNERRDELIAKSLDYFLEHGVAELSLRPLAQEIGTSARMVVYHFGSKAGLITAVMDEVRAGIQKSFAAALVDSRTKPSGSVIHRFWARMIQPSNIRYLRLLLEVQVLAMHNPARYARYLERTSSSWLEIIEASLPSSRENRIVATLYAAVIDGLLLEYLSTGDDQRTTKALDCFRGLMKARARRTRKFS